MSGTHEEDPPPWQTTPAGARARRRRETRRRGSRPRLRREGAATGRRRAVEQAAAGGAAAGEAPSGHWQPPPGWQPGGQPQYGHRMTWQPAPPTPGAATASLLVGITAVILLPLVGPVAVWLGSRAKRRIDASQGALGGRAVASGAVAGLDRCAADAGDGGPGRHLLRRRLIQLGGTIVARSASAQAQPAAPSTTISPRRVPACASVGAITRTRESEHEQPHHDQRHGDEDPEAVVGEEAGVAARGPGERARPAAQRARQPRSTPGTGTAASAMCRRARPPHRPRTARSRWPAGGLLLGVRPSLNA